jgi:hypothetical protein
LDPDDSLYEDLTLPDDELTEDLPDEYPDPLSISLLVGTE